MRRSRRLMVALVAAATLAGPSTAGPQRFLNGVVEYVVDGDTLAVKDAQGDIVTVRLSGIDSPEKAWNGRWDSQPFSASATRFATELAAGKHVSVRLIPGESYGRAIGEVFVDGRSLNRELVRAGLAWWNRRHEPYDYDLKRLEEAARASRKGLWSEPDAVPPWQHRQGGR